MSEERRTTSAGGEAVHEPSPHGSGSPGLPPGGDEGRADAAGRFSRRRFLRGVALSAGAAAVPAEGLLARAAGAFPPGLLPEGPAPLGPGAAPVTLNVNGKEVKLKVEPRVTLLDALRDHLDVAGSRPVDLTGSKRVCDRGSCGACTMIVDGRPVYSCTLLAVEVEGRKIETVEGIGTEAEPHPLQEAFVHCDGLMCGFCTPGFVVSAKALLDQNPHPTHQEICRGLNGNICRCGTYIRVFEAVNRASEQMRAVKGG